MTAIPPEYSLRKVARIARLKTYSWLLVAAALAIALVSFAMTIPVEKVALLSVAAGFVGLFLAVQGVALLVRLRARSVQRHIMSFLAHDATPGLTTNFEGEITFQNASALEKFGAQDGKLLRAALANFLANPEAVIMRLRRRLEDQEAAREDVLTRRGHVRIGVQKIETGLLWRIEDTDDTTDRTGDSIAVPLFTLNQSGAVLYVNPPLRQALGFRPKKVSEFIEPLPLRSGALVTVRGAAQSSLARAYINEGSVGRREVFLFAVEDSEKDKRDKIDPLFNSLPVPLLHLDASGNVLRASRMALAILPELEEQRRPLPHMLEGLGRPVADWIAEAARGRGLNRSEVVRVTDTEPEQYLQVTLGRVLLDGVASLVAVLNDATELKTLEAQMVQSQKMQAIGQLAGGVAHDFNNLLTAISGHCDLLLLRHDKGDEDFADLVQINQNANRAAALVGQLLAFSRKQTLQPERLDLRDTLAELTHLLNRLVGEKVHLSLSNDPGLLPIRADKRQLEQVLMNLVVNARDAMPAGGTIKVETHCEYLDHDLKRDRVVVPAGQYVVVKVIDTGTGIPKDKIGRIFEPFFTTKKTGEGTGLGLSMAYGIIKQTGGFIFANSVEGEGTEFALYFPADEGTSALPQAGVPSAGGLGALAHVPPNPAGSPKMADTHVPPGVTRALEPIAPPEPAPASEVHDAKIGPERQQDGVVLLVEDEAPVRAFASRALRLRGFTVLEAACAEEALETLSDASLSVDLFVTDVMMPGMDGPTWVREALKDRPDVKTVFVSGYPQSAFSDEREAVPNSVFLPKPFSLAELTRTVQQQIT